MATLSLAQNPFVLDDFAEQITASSNFRFAWQFYNVTNGSVQTAAEAAVSLSEVIARVECHQFLRKTFDPTRYKKEFAVHPLSSDALIVNADKNFEVVMARAANNRLGAYSNRLIEPAPAEVSMVAGLFSQAGPYLSFQLAESRSAATHGGYLFSSWFYGVAWDWCFVLSWPIARLLWVGCLTDTD